MERRIRFELLYAKHAPAVKAYVLRRAHPSMADDVVAEVFLVCWRRFEQLPTDPLPWLLGVTRRVLSTQRRGERRDAALADRLASEPQPGAIGAHTDEPSLAGPAADRPLAQGAEAPLAETPRAETPLAEGADSPLARALGRLSRDDRELLLLIAWDGLSPAQAAEALGVRAATARVRLHRARRRFANALERERHRSVACAPLTMEASS